MPQTLMDRLLAKMDLAGKVTTCKLMFHRNTTGEAIGLEKIHGRLPNGSWNPGTQKE